MAGPSTKQQLLDQVQQERELWEALLAEIGFERMEVPGVTRDWTMKDTIAHMTTWWRREVALLASVQRNERPPDHPPQSQVPIIMDTPHKQGPPARPCPARLARRMAAVCGKAPGDAGTDPI